MAWELNPKEEWIHLFLHTLDEIPRKWYISTELQREITMWEELTVSFSHNFSFLNDDSIIHSALQHIRNIVLEIVPVALPAGLQETPVMTLLTKCHNVTRDPDDDDTLDINIPESEGMREVEGLGISSDQFLNPLKVKKVILAH